MLDNIVRCSLAASAVLLLAGSAAAQDVTGAGASFPAPIYAKWADAYNKATGARINYQSVGSGAGIKQIKSKTVDFGASDAPLTDEELAKDGLIQFPTVIGGVVPVVNVKGIKPGQLKLTGAVLGDIYLGKITKWNDPAITALNPGVPLPDDAIAVGAPRRWLGHHFIFTNYLSKVNPEWKAKVGEGTAVNWPTGAGGKGNEGVSAFVQRLPNSIGYVEYAYAKQNKMSYVQLKNKDGNFAKPDDDSLQGGSRRCRLVEELLPGPDRPAGQGCLAHHRRHLHPDAQDRRTSRRTRRNALKFFDWAYASGDKLADDWTTCRCLPRSRTWRASRGPTD